MKFRKSIFSKALLAVGIITGSSVSASAQYSQIANQLPGLISPMLSGSLNYKGYVEASYLKGIGNKNVDFLSFSTSQGFRYSSWFFMGVGLGADVVFTHTNDENKGNGPWADAPNDPNLAKTGVMIPIFTDFRANIGGMQSTAFFVDLKLGCSFLAGNNYLQVGDGYLTNREYFYLRPSIGVRIPTNPNNKAQAVNIGVDYQLLTANYWSYWTKSTTISALGATLSYEW